MGDTGAFGSGLDIGGAGDASAGQPMDITPGADVPPGRPEEETRPAQARSEEPSRGGLFGSGIGFGGPTYRPPDANASVLDQTADTLQQRIARANQIAANPMLQFFNPEGVQKARDFVPAAAEKLQQIRVQQAGMAAGRQQSATLGLAPGEVPDEATQADRVEVAKARALKGDLNTFKGLQAVDPKAAEAIQDQVHEVVAGHLTKAQFAFDKLSNMRNQGEYTAAVRQLRQDGTLTDLEALGLKVPASFDAFGAAKAKEGQALREAQIGVATVRQKLEERNTYQPMEEKEAKTYNGRLTTVYGDQITNGTWGRNAAAGTRGLIVNGAGDPRDLGKSYTLATPEQRKAIHEEFQQAVPKADLEKQRAFDRTYELATKVTTDGVYDDGKGGKVRLKKGDDFPAGLINTNPNVQQGIAEGLASMLRGGTGGANVGLLKIETGKRGVVQGVLDSLVTAYAGGVNTLSEKEIRPYLTKLTQAQQRDVLDGIKQYNDATLEDRAGAIARRAGALGLGPSSFGFGKEDAAGAVANAIEQGRQEQVARMLPNHQAIGGGDGVFQLGAQRPGAGATGTPPGTAPTTQLPGAAPVQTPVQQAGAPPAPAPAAPPAPLAPGGGAPPAVAPAPPGPQGSPPAAPGPAGGSPAPAAPVTIAGQQVAFTPPAGASPSFVPALQRIETGKSKDPWTAEAGKGPNGKPVSTASGAYQMLDGTWNENKPAGAPARAKDATPAQQTEAFTKFTAANAAALQAAGVPLNDTSLYVAHNLGGAGGARLLTADPNADARTVAGETAARNNPLFFRGKPTVATVLERYKAEMDKGALPAGGEPPAGVKPLPGSETAAAGGSPSKPDEATRPGLLARIGRILSQGVPGSGEDKDKAARAVGDAAVEHAPAIGSTLGMVGGVAVGGIPGGVAGGAAGGGAGQSLKDYLQGREQNPTAIAKEAALGGVLGVASPARPFVAAGARMAGAGAVGAGAEAVHGGDAADIAEAGMKGAGLAAGGEAFGRALGMAGHKVWNLFAPDAKTAVREAAGKFATAEETLAKEAPKLPSVNGAAGGPNPKYEAAERARVEAETVLKDAGLKPEEAAYAHRVASEPGGVPQREAEAARPGALEQSRVGAGYQQLESEVGAAGRGAVKPTPKLADGPRALVENKQVSAAHAELAEHVEAAITAPAKSWQDKWVQLKDARSDLLQAERDALTSTSPGRTKTAADMRALADSVRVQQEKAAKYVFGEKDGEAFMQRLKVLDTRYRNLMEATNGGDLARAAALKGEAGRDADKKFRAFAHDDPAALAAWTAMRQKGVNLEQGVHDLVAAERIPVLGKVFSAMKLAGSFNRWMRERAAGNPATFESILNAAPDTTGRTLRDLTGTAAQRGAVM